MRLLLLLGLAGFLLAPAAAAADPPFELVSRGEQPLTVHGWTDNEPTFTVSFLASNPTAKPYRIDFLPGDLTQEGGPGRIGRDTLALLPAAPLNLAAGGKLNVTIKAKPPRSPGRYAGKVEFKSDDATVPSWVYELVVEANATPQVNLLGPARGSLVLVNATSWPNAWLARQLLPPALTRDGWVLPLENPGVTPVAVESVKVIDETADAMPALAAGFADTTGGLTIPGGDASGYRLQVRRSELPAGKFLGEALVKVPGGKTLKVPVDVQVRDGPLLPLVLLLVGIGFGQLAKYMQAKGDQTVLAVNALNRLKLALDGADREDAGIVRGPFERLGRDLEEERLVDLEKRADTLRGQLGELTQLRDLEGRVRDQDKLPDDKKQKVQGLIDQARELYRSEQYGTAATIGLSAKTTFANELANLPAAATPRSSKRSAQAAPATALDRVTTSWQYRLLRHAQLFLKVLFLLILSAVGFQALYADRGVTFGSNPLPDVIALLTWGLSADVASRTLSTVAKA